MGLPRFSFLKLLLSKQTLQSHKPFTNPPPKFTFFIPSLTTRTYHYHPSNETFKDHLHQRVILSTARSPNESVIPVLDLWVHQGNPVKETDLQRIVRTLRSKKRFARALEVSEWMTRKKLGPSTSASNHAVQLDLIGKVHGADAAEKYFNEVDDRSEQVYGALLNCYVREGLVYKSLSHFRKMKDVGLAHNPLTYNGIMTLYMNTGQVEKIPEVLLEMEKDDVSPDNVSYRICLKAYESRSDFASMENLLNKIEKERHVSIDWRTYTAVANYYLKGGLHEKAIHYLQKAEAKVKREAAGYNHLISVYANVGDLSQVMRLWEKQKLTCQRQINVDFMTVMGSLVKLGELQEAERIFQDWESSNMFYDFRVPNVLLIGYTQQGMVEKAERMLEGIISRGRTPVPNSWSIIATGHVKNQNMDKAVECMKRALQLVPASQGWLPKPELISSMLNWLAENSDVEEVEAFLKLLSAAVPMDREMHHTLLKANVRHGRKIDGILQKMKDDNIEVDDETEKILSSAAQDRTSDLG